MSLGFGNNMEFVDLQNPTSGSSRKDSIKSRLQQCSKKQLCKAIEFLLDENPSDSHSDATDIVDNMRELQSTIEKKIEIALLKSLQQDHAAKDQLTKRKISNSIEGQALPAENPSQKPKKKAKDLSK